MFVLTVVVTRSDTIHFSVKMQSQYCENLCAVNFGIQDLSVHLCGLETSNKEICEARLFGF